MTALRAIVEEIVLTPDNGKLGIVLKGDFLEASDRFFIGHVLGGSPRATVRTLTLLAIAPRWGQSSHGT